MKYFVEIPVRECGVVDAYDYSRREKHPYIELLYRNNKLVLNDRHIIFRFLRALDSELKYADMMYTIYELTTQERPSLKDIVKGYLHNTSITHIGVWVDEESIVAIEDPQNHSKYFDTTMAYIQGNYLTDFETSVRHMSPYGRAAYKSPVMCFTKDTIKIEILSYKNTTKIVGRYKVGGCWVQPVATQVIKRWVHTIPQKTFEEMLYKIIKVLDNMDTLEIKTIGIGGDSQRLNDFYLRSKLESENMRIIDVKILEKINSFSKL